MLKPVPFSVGAYECEAKMGWDTWKGDYYIDNLYTGFRYTVCSATPIIVRRPLGDCITVSADEFNQKFVYAKDGLYLPKDKWTPVRCMAAGAVMAQLVPIDGGRVEIDGMVCNRPEVPHALGDFIVYRSNNPDVRWVENGLHFLTIAKPVL